MELHGNEAAMKGEMYEKSDIGNAYFLYNSGINYANFIG